MSVSRNRKAGVVVLAVMFVLSMTGLVSAAPVTVGLGTTEDFAVLAGTEVTNVPTSDITGDVGLSPGTGAGIIGLTCPEVDGTIYAVDAFGPALCAEENPSLLTIAKNDLITAYDDAEGRGLGTTVLTELGGQTLNPGVYSSASTTFEVSAPDPLILDAEGDPDGVFIFEMDSGGTGLTVGPGSEIQLTGEAQACNVFWRLNTASIDTTAIFKGNILALTSITVEDSANIEGRLLARNGNVTLINDTITVPTCLTSSSDSGSGGTTGAGSSGSNTPGLPDTGINPGAANSWGIMIPGAIFVALFSNYLVRKQEII